MKRAIVLSGGGTKGAYELGVWRALRELGIDYQIVTGTSIGSINGALMAMKDFEGCENMWKNLTMEDMMQDGITVSTSLTKTMEDFYNQKQSLRPFLKKYFKNKGLDNSPFTDFIEKHIDEERLRNSEVDFGLVTVKVKGMTPMMLPKSEIPEGLLKDYVIASSSVFPAFPMHKIGDETYLDGCYYDNLPIDLAVNMGATEIIAVDLHTTPQHPNHAKRPYVKTILPTQDLGGVLDFDHDRMDRNANLGYLDTLKAYGKLKGKRYYFEPESFQGMQEEIDKLCMGIARGEASLMKNSKNKMEKAGDIYRMFGLFEEATQGKTPEKVDYFICAAEACADFFGMDKSRVYNMRSFATELKGMLKQARSYPDSSVFLEENENKLLKRLAEVKMKKDGAYLVGCLYYGSKDGTVDFEKHAGVLPYLPAEMAATLFLESV